MEFLIVAKLHAYHFTFLICLCTHSKHPHILIGKMDQLCMYCQALKFQKEAPGMCCSKGKISLQPLNEPPEPLQSYVSGTTAISKYFLSNIRKFNSAFQMTSFGASKVVYNIGFIPTFKIQGQIYHKIGSLLPIAHNDAKFLQVYFMGNCQQEFNRRCHIAQGMNQEIIKNLQTFFHAHNQLFKLFKIALDRMPSDEYQIVIRADKTPSGEHERRFNTPTIDEVAIIMVDNECDRRDIILHKRDSQLKRVSETHRSYDALQYPMLFWQGEDGYHFNIMQNNSPGPSKKVNYFKN